MATRLFGNRSKKNADNWVPIRIVGRRGDRSMFGGSFNFRRSRRFCQNLEIVPSPSVYTGTKAPEDGNHDARAASHETIHHRTNSLGLSRRHAHCLSHRLGNRIYYRACDEWLYVYLTYA
jgi:hypothetical protein